jgi:Tfp pilus assembly protein PilF
MRGVLPFLLLTALGAPAWCARQTGESSSASKANETEPHQRQREAVDAKKSTAEKDIEVASFYMRKGDPNAAIGRLREAVQLAPENAKPRLMLAEAYEKAHDDDLAVETYQDYLKAFPRASDTKKIQKKIEKLKGR